jgi:hypothetical protein
MSVTLTCKRCRATGTVNRRTAGLRCTCGSKDFTQLGEQGFLEFMGAASGPGTGWGKSMPDTLKGWNEYAGPMPGANPDYAGNTAADERCSNCDGSGWSLREKCRACFGTGKHTPPTEPGPAPLVAKHPGQTSVPFVGRRKKAGRHQNDPDAMPSNLDVVRSTTPGFGERGQMSPQRKDFAWDDTSSHYPGADSHSPAVQYREPKDYSDEALANAGPYVMHGADCPNCGHEPTHLVKDAKDDAWWHCPNCGPLANIDRNPEINPYDEHKDFEPNSGFKAKASRGGKRTGRALSMIARVQDTNPGLRQHEVVGLVLRTLKRYPE